MIEDFICGIWTLFAIIVIYEFRGLDRCRFIIALYMS